MGKFTNYAILVVFLITVKDVHCRFLQTAADGNETSTGEAAFCDVIARYKLSFEGFWTEGRFSKQYPLYRPHAQWSDLVGRSHNDEFVLWRLGEVSTAAFKDFVEKGEAHGLDHQSQGQSGILDAFKSTNLPTGEGVTWLTFFADTRHSKLSVVSRIVPSPDWFVGVDSLNLLDESGKWISRKIIDLFPKDAGTDKGFTFTSPNWAEEPWLPVSEITSLFPDHPANSFFYPELEQLPALARLTVELVGTLAPEPGNTDQRVNVSVENSSTTETNGKTTNINHMEQIVEESIVPVTRKPLERSRANRKHKKINGSDALAQYMTTTPRPSTVGLKTTIDTGPLDCVLGDWGDWSECSKSCGYGFRTRRRKVEREAQNGGMPCSLEKEEEMCGSLRNCGWQQPKLSDWSWTGAGK